jgi:uncharacterized protein (TIGR02001 family)
MTRPLLHAAACLLAAPATLAAPPQWGGSVTLASNHLLRGISRSSNEPSLAAELHAQSTSGWFAGLWSTTSRVRQQDSTTLDLAATLGIGGAPGENWSWRASVSHYDSPWQYRPGFYRYDELALDLRWREHLLVSVSFSPDTSAYSHADGPVWRRDAWAYEATWQQALRSDLHAYAGAGYYDLSDLFGEGYWYGSIGLAWSRRQWRADVSYIHPGDAARRLSYAGTARRGPLFTLSYLFGR